MCSRQITIHHVADHAAQWHAAAVLPGDETHHAGLANVFTGVGIGCVQPLGFEDQAHGAAFGAGG